MVLPTLGRGTRLLALTYGLALFFWLSLEDTSVAPVVAFGFGLAILIIGLTTLDKIGGQWLTVRHFFALTVLSGVALGLGTSVATAVLMFFKNARHAHLFPDYPTGMIVAMLERAPWWGVAGGLLGLSLGLGWLAMRRKENERPV
ncbi:MAG: hypothetical protein CL610_26560 [Anaerolineaceae bacterium]|nr:hypothetical protein [Anaerolineaceae bacterium]